MAENNLNLNSEESDDQDIPVSQAITKFNKNNNTTKRKLHRFSSSNEKTNFLLTFP